MKANTYKNIGPLCREARIKNNKSQSYMAKIYNCTTANISEFERGNTHSLGLLLTYIKEFDISIKELLDHV